MIYFLVGFEVLEKMHVKEKWPHRKTGLLEELITKVYYLDLESLFGAAVISNALSGG